MAIMAATAGSCALGRVDLSAKACPCALGWRCDAETNRCVRSGVAQADDAGGTDAAPQDGEMQGRGDGGVDGGADGAMEMDAGPTVDPDLIVWLTMDDAPVGGTIADTSGHAHDGMCVPDCPPRTAGRVGQAADFDGATYLRVVHDAELDLDAFTLSAWIRPASSSMEWRGIVGRPFNPETSNENSYGLFHQHDDVLTFETFAGVQEDNLDSGEGTLASGTWYHVAGTLDASGTKHLYLDGELLESRGEDAPLYEATDLLVGVDHDDGVIDGFFDGAIDDVRVYRRALSAGEIAALATAE